MNIGHISGGTNAGWRRVKQAHAAWDCPSCGEKQLAHRNQCFACNSPRPN